MTTALVVEDNPFSRELVIDILRMYGIAAQEAVDWRGSCKKSAGFGI